MFMLLLFHFFVFIDIDVAQDVARICSHMIIDIIIMDLPCSSWTLDQDATSTYCLSLDISGINNIIHNLCRFAWTLFDDSYPVCS